MIMHRLRLQHLSLFLLTILMAACGGDPISDAFGPTVWIDVPVDNLHLEAPQAIQIEGHASAPEGISYVEIWVNGEIIQTIDALTVEIQEEEEAGTTPDACQQCVENLIAAGLCGELPPEEQELCNAFAHLICFFEFGVCSPCPLIDVFCPLVCEEDPDPVSCELKCRILLALEIIYVEFGVDCLGMCNNPAKFCEESCAIMEPPEDQETCVAGCIPALTALCTGQDPPLP